MEIGGEGRRGRGLVEPRKRVEDPPRPVQLRCPRRRMMIIKEAEEDGGRGGRLHCRASKENPRAATKKTGRFDAFGGGDGGDTKGLV